MDSSTHVFGQAEECHSSESGWTMYIGSPSNDEDDGDGELDDEDFHEDDDARDKNIIKAHHEDDDTDDSMASDASSGPSHHRDNFSRNAKIGQAKNVPKEKLGNGKSCLNYKAKKNGYDQSEDKEESFFTAKGTTRALSNGGKVKRSSWMSKKK